MTPLRLFWQILTEKEELRLHLKYVENLLSDYIGNNLVREINANSDAEKLGKS